jgi:signal peptidase II
MTRRIAILLIAAFGCVGCDQSAKAVARHFLEPGEQISFLGDTLRLTLIENAGSFLSLGDSLPQGIRNIMFLGIVPLLLIAFAAYFALGKGVRTDKMIAAGLFVGGGLGNLVDRVINDGRVFDFLNVGIGGIRTGIFNVADMVLMFAMVYLVLAKDRLTTSKQPQEP